VRPGRRRKIVRKGLVMALGTVATLGGIASAVTVSTRWAVAAVNGANPGFQLATPIAPTLPVMAEADDLATGSVGYRFASAEISDYRNFIPRLEFETEAEVIKGTSVPATVAAALTKEAAELAAAIPLPQARPKLAYARPDIDVLPVTPAPTAADLRTAVYDIEAHTVYLPSGLKLEAHSGLGEWMDDPDSLRRKNRGVTPPNVYELKLRESLFHGVQAIRMNPVDEDKMFGRDGILAHSYMLGPNGQSNGCVSFKDYDQFLRAFQRGEVNRMIVLVRHGREQAARLHGRPVEKYAFNSTPTAISRRQSYQREDHQRQDYPPQRTELW
jgi:hypothetical protein